MVRKIHDVKRYGHIRGCAASLFIPWLCFTEENVNNWTLMCVYLEMTEGHNRVRRTADVHKQVHTDVCVCVCFVSGEWFWNLL